MPSIFFHITSRWRATRSFTYDNFIVIQPYSHTHALSAFLSQPPRGTGQTSSTHFSLSPFFLMPPRGIRLPTLSVRDQFFLFSTTWHKAKVPDTLLYGSSTELFFLTPPRGTEQKSSTYRSTGPPPNFFPHEASWHRAEVLNTLLYRFRPNFCLFHAKEQKSSTHCSIGPRPHFYLFHATTWQRAKVLNTLLYRSSTEFSTFFTPLRSTEQKSVTHHSIGSPPKPLFFKFKFTPLHGTKQNVHELPKLFNRSSTEPNNSSNDLIYQIFKKNQP